MDIKKYFERYKQYNNEEINNDIEIDKQIKQSILPTTTNNKKIIQDKNIKDEIKEESNKIDDIEIDN